MSRPRALKSILEAALLAAGKTLSLEQMTAMFADGGEPERHALIDALEELRADYEGRGMELKQVASGYRIQVRADYAHWVSRLWDEKPGRYSRALMETLALIAYRQPITRGEIEEIRGVSVNTYIVKTLIEREWVRVVGHRDVPGRPALYATTRAFLDYFGLRSLDELPTLAEIRDLDEIDRELDLEETQTRREAAGDEPPHRGLPIGDGDVETLAQSEDDSSGSIASEMPNGINLEEQVIEEKSKD